MSGFELVVPSLVVGIVLYAAAKRVDIFKTFVKGARENLIVAWEILPSLTALCLAVGMLRSSGAAELISNLLEPLKRLIGLPAECVPLALMRPVSGSGALSMLEELLSSHGPDSFVGRVASVLMGSTETTFYTVAVYFGATKIKRTRQTLPSALLGDLTAFILSALTVRLILGS